MLDRVVTLTSTRIYDLHYSTYTHVPGSVSIHIFCTIVLDYGELLAYWFILQLRFCPHGLHYALLAQALPLRLALCPHGMHYALAAWSLPLWLALCAHGLGFALAAGLCPCVSR